MDQHRLAEETGALFIVRSTAVDYLSPARLDDVITTLSRIERIGRASVDFAQEAWRDGTLLATGSIRVGCVDGATLRPAAIPPRVLDALRRGPTKAWPVRQRLTLEHRCYDASELVSAKPSGAMLHKAFSAASG